MRAFASLPRTRDTVHNEARSVVRVRERVCVRVHDVDSSARARARASATQKLNVRDNISGHRQPAEGAPGTRGACKRSVSHRA